MDGICRYGTNPLRGHVLTDILENLPLVFYNLSHNMHMNIGVTFV